MSYRISVSLIEVASSGIFVKTKALLGYIVDTNGVYATSSEAKYLEYTTLSDAVAHSMTLNDREKAAHQADPAARTMLYQAALPSEFQAAA